MTVVDVVTYAPVAFAAGVIVGYRLHNRYRITRVSHVENPDRVRDTQLPEPDPLPTPPNTDMGRQQQTGMEQPPSTGTKT